MARWLQSERGSALICSGLDYLLCPEMDFGYCMNHPQAMRQPVAIKKLPNLALVRYSVLVQQNLTNFGVRH